MQSTGGEIRGPSTAEAGTTIEIQVQGDAAQVSVVITGTQGAATYPVGPDKKIQVPVPPGSAGQLILVEIKGPFPLSSLTILIVSKSQDSCRSN